MVIATFHTMCCYSFNFSILQLDLCSLLCWVSIGSHPLYYTPTNLMNMVTKITGKKELFAYPLMVAVACGVLLLLVTREFRTWRRKLV